MAIKIIVSNKLKFKVKGTIKDEEGRDQPFDFTLTCTRLDQDQIKAKLGPNADDTSVVDFMLELCRIPGVSVVAFRTYLAEVGAKEKN